MGEDTDPSSIGMKLENERCLDPKRSNGLRKYNLDARNVIEYRRMKVQPELSYIEHPMESIDGREYRAD